MPPGTEYDQVHHMNSLFSELEYFNTVLANSQVCMGGKKVGTSQLFLEKSGEKFQFQHLFKEFSGIVPIQLSGFLV